MEMRDIVDDNDNVIRKTDLLVLRKENLLHRAVGILLFNSKGELFVHQRNENAGIYAGYWAIFLTGGVTSGEEYDTTAVRELAEETGIDNAQLNFLFKTRYEDSVIRMYAQIYSLVFDGPLKLQEEEIAHGSFITLDELQDMIKTNTFVPNQIVIFNEYLEKFNDPAVKNI